MAIDHLVINTSPEHHEATVAFYLAALEPLGYRKMIEFFDGKVVALGATDPPDFWIGETGLSHSGRTVVTNAHFAFRAEGVPRLILDLDRSTVDKCYGRGLAAGGKDNGPPGVRPQYGAQYYGGFLFDPEGNNMEVVCKKAPA